jgi:hypothetical protein
MLALIGSVSAFVFQTGLLAILAWLVGWAAGFFFSAHTVWLLEMATLTMIPAGILCLYVFWEWQEQERRRQRVAKTSLESEERRKQVESQRQGQQKRIEERHLKRLNRKRCADTTVDWSPEELSPDSGRPAGFAGLPARFSGAIGITDGASGGNGLGDLLVRGGMTLALFRSRHFRQEIKLPLAVDQDRDQQVAVLCEQDALSPFLAA